MRPIAALALAAIAAACADNEPAIARGDRLWADSNYVGALAEYRLAVGQRGDDDARLRLAHAYARAGELGQARDQYAALVEQAPERAEQAVRDLLLLADRARARGDEYGAASAVEAALTMAPELQIPDQTARLARFYAERDEPERALAYYRRALSAVAPDSAPRLLYEMGLLHENNDRCAVAVDFYRAFREQAARAGSTEQRGPMRSLVTESRWHLGSCTFRLAGEAAQAGRLTDALAGYARVIELGEPENLLDQAWFEHGETLYALARYDEALESYRTVLERNPSRTGQLVERARRRMDQIRFGRTDGGQQGNRQPSIGES